MAAPNEHWANEPNEFSGSDDAGAFMALRKIAGIAGNEEVSLTGFSTS
jgi:hypothetical protein